MPYETSAQQPAKVWRIGYLSPAATVNPVDEAFEKSLELLGGHEIGTSRSHIGTLAGRQDKLAPLVAEVVGLSLDLFVAWSPPLAFGVKQAAPQSPLVFLMGSDAAEIGFLSNLAASAQIMAKRLELRKEAVPSLARMAVLFSTEQTRSRPGMDALSSSAKALSIKLDVIEVEAPSGLETAMRGAKNRGAQALFAWRQWIRLFVRKANL